MSRRRRHVEVHRQQDHAQRMYEHMQHRVRRHIPRPLAPPQPPQRPHQRPEMVHRQRPRDPLLNNQERLPRVSRPRHQQNQNDRVGAEQQDAVLADHGVGVRLGDGEGRRRV